MHLRTIALASTDRLLIFTRYPVAGKAKTRLIPALGAEAAANLQRQMTEHTLAQVQLLKTTFPLSVEVWFAGTSSETEQADQQQMQVWLGDQWVYQPQRGSDLGDRLIHAIQSAFEFGMERIVTVGTDCPRLDADRMRQAFDALQQADVVLGPATDGGYYLIGLRRLVPALFSGIAWGSETVLQQTIEIAERLGLTIAYLDPLTDVDRPEDLTEWEAVQLGAAAECQTDQSSTTEQVQRPVVSVIIPVLDEADLIEPLLRSLRLAEVEIIVVDGGSQDNTVELALQLGAKVLHSDRGRAIQMNAGAKAATSEILLFLHADTQLPVGFVSIVQQTLAQPKIVAGAFELAIDGNAWGLRWIEWGVKWRSRLLQLPYGDQAIFLRAEIFHQFGGFAQLPIMEDFELVRRLQKYGKIAIVPARVLTSARRWQKVGLLKTTLLNQIVIAAFLLKISPERIAQWYRSQGIKHQAKVAQLKPNLATTKNNNE